jgi:outer membrane protein OmpA-like peptidoglycan-associated protein
MRYESESEIDRELEAALAELEEELAAQEAELVQEAEEELEASCQGGTNESVSGFTRYSNAVRSLPQSQRARIQAIARRIKQSFRPGCPPILRVRIVGHADNDPQRESREPGYMLKVSEERAAAVEDELNHLLGPDIASQIAWESHGVGNAGLVVKNPVTEAQRAKNRRVEIEASTDPRSCASGCELDFQNCMSLARGKTERGRCASKRRGCLARCQGVPV